MFEPRPGLFLMNFGVCDIIAISQICLVPTETHDMLLYFTFFSHGIEYKFHLRNLIFSEFEVPTLPMYFETPWTPSLFEPFFLSNENALNPRWF